jgi:hypothetical protein
MKGFRPLNLWGSTGCPGLGGRPECLWLNWNKEKVMPTCCKIVLTLSDPDIRHLLFSLKGNVVHNRYYGEVNLFWQRQARVKNRLLAAIGEESVERARARKRYRENAKRKAVLKAQVEARRRETGHGE